uniref:DUF1998 domain-containing protein n=1 Tax=Eubacterium cellulosolvens TaxID=29322 RepID=UPI0006851535|nr:DUF1998 domain-containing protein [[Eubacterium] cellulosolvens]
MKKSINYQFPMMKPGYQTRASQSILQYGVGAMVDFPDQTLMTAAPEVWAGSVTEIHDERLEKALHIDYIGMPGSRSNDINTKAGISYVRFPEWYFCPVCRRFQKISEWKKEYVKYAASKTKENDPHMLKRLQCFRCGCPLVAAGIIRICSNGHVDDFPWVEWAHIKSIPKKEICASPQIEFRTGNSVTEGLQGLVVACTSCKASATLKEAFYPNVFQNLIDEGYVEEFRCKGRHPWNGTRCHCGQIPYTKQKGDSSVYFSISVSSIVIPTETDACINKIRECRKYKTYELILSEFEEKTEREEFLDQKYDSWCENISELLLIEPRRVKKLLKGMLLQENKDREEVELDSTEYRYQEYEALAGLMKYEIEGSEDFLREEMDVEEYDIPGLKKVVLVKKLREVRALIGFSRMVPISPNKMDESGFVKIKEDETNWYPGYEVRGEGIFLQFDQDMLDEWSKSDFVIHRQEIMKANYVDSFMGKQSSEEPDAEFVFLHTLAHLLMKQVSFECGYNIASLRERLYYRPQVDGEDGMAGILLYTASGDSEGTLGGLVRQGRRDCFPRIFKEAINKARFCSNDPICITSTGQGRESLNMAACHSCGLVPETSCEKYNAFLDRGLIVGTFENQKDGFYSNWK